MFLLILFSHIFKFYFPENQFFSSSELSSRNGRASDCWTCLCWILKSQAPRSVRLETWGNAPCSFAFDIYVTLDRPLQIFNHWLVVLILLSCAASSQQPEQVAAFENSHIDLGLLGRSFWLKRPVGKSSLDAALFISRTNTSGSRAACSVSLKVCAMLVFARWLNARRTSNVGFLRSRKLLTRQSYRPHLCPSAFWPVPLFFLPLKFDFLKSLCQ